MKKAESPKKSLIRGAAWSIAARWSIRGLGFASTLLLARLLDPEDYGLVAMAMLVVGLVGAVSDFGVAAALLRMPTVDRDDIDSAWTLGAIQGLVIGSAIAIGAPIAAFYFQEPRLVPILLLIAVCNAIACSGNIGLLLARRELNFGLEYRHNVAAKLFSVVVTVSCAYYLRDYRALVIGIVSGYLGGWVLGYVMHPYRAKWNTSRLASQWGFGRWMLIGGIGGYVSRKADEILAGRIGGPQGLGTYSMGSELGQLATGELGPPILRALLPVLSSLQDSPSKLRQAVLQTLAGLNTITLPVGLLMAMISYDFVHVFLGEKWVEAGLYFSIFAVYGSVNILTAPLQNLLILCGRSKEMAFVVWIEFCAFVVLALVLVQAFGLVGLAWSRLGSGLVMMTGNLYLACRYGSLRAKELAMALFRPVLGSMAMVIVLYGVDASLTLDVGIGRLLLESLAGVVFYSIWMYVSWVMARRPDGLESTISDVVGGIAAQRLKLK